MSQRIFEACIGNSTKILTCGKSGKELDIITAICENQGWGSCNRCIACKGTNVLDEVKELCQGQRACTSLTHASDPSNICKKDNYLTVTYNCIHPATTEPSTSSSVNETSLPTRSVFNINSHETTSVLKTTYAETTSVSIKRSEYKPTEAFQGRLSSSLDTATTVAIAISGALVLLLIIPLILVCLKRGRRSKKESGREVESAECSANARSVGLFMNQAFQSDADYRIPATLPAGDGDYENPDDVRPVAGQSYVNCPALPGDGDYAQPDATRLPLQEAPGYQPLKIQTSNWAQPAGDAAYADYDVASSRQEVGESYVNCPKMPGDCDYAEPDATGPPLQEAPGYQPLQIQPSNDVAYAQYDLASSERNIDA